VDRQSYISERVSDDMATEAAIEEELGRGFSSAA
jgi:hypothetical protein